MSQQLQPMGESLRDMVITSTLPSALVAIIIDYLGTTIEGKSIRKTKICSFRKPSGVSVSKAGETIAVSEPWVNTVTLLDSRTFQIKHVIGTPDCYGHSVLQLATPWGVKIVHDVCFVADTMNNRIQVFNLNHTTHTHSINLNHSSHIPIPIYSHTLGSKWGNGGQELCNPVSITIYGEEIFILEKGNKQISILHTRNGNRTRFWAQNGKNHGKNGGKNGGKTKFEYEESEFRFGCDSGIGIGNNELFFSDIGQNRIVVMNLMNRQEVTVKNFIGCKQLKNPTGLIVDDPFIYVGDNTHRILIFNLDDGKLRKIIGDGELNEPSGMSLLGGGEKKELLIAEYGNHRLQVFH